MAKNWSNLPVPAPGNMLLPHISARARTGMIDAIFEGLGGFPAMLAWAETNLDTRTEFYKMYAKGAAKSTNVEVGVSEGVENLLEKLDQEDRAANAKIIEGEVLT